MEQLKIIGTSHISKQSVQEIKKSINEETPDIIALELDLQRASSLLEQQKSKISLAVISKIGLKGYIFAKFGQIVQQKLGKMVGVAPGSEMKTALKLAHKKKLQIALIDQPIQITLKNFSRELTWKEKFRFVGDLFLGVFFRKRQIKKLGLTEFDLTKVPADKIIDKMMLEMKNNYPSVYKTLVSDRNKYMFKQLVNLIKSNPGKNILAIVGAGHKKGIEKMLLKIDIINH